MQAVKPWDWINKTKTKQDIAVFLKDRVPGISDSRIGEVVVDLRHHAKNAVNGFASETMARKWLGRYLNASAWLESERPVIEIALFDVGIPKIYINGVIRQSHFQICQTMPKNGWTRQQHLAQLIEVAPRVLESQMADNNILTRWLSDSADQNTDLRRDAYINIGVRRYITKRTEGKVVNYSLLEDALQEAYSRYLEESRLGMAFSPRKLTQWFITTAGNYYIEKGGRKTERENRARQKLGVLPEAINEPVGDSTAAEQIALERVVQDALHELSGREFDLLCLLLKKVKKDLDSKAKQKRRPPFDLEPVMRKYNLQYLTLRQFTEKYDVDKETARRQRDSFNTLFQKLLCEAMEDHGTLSWVRDAFGDFDKEDE